MNHIHCFFIVILCMMPSLAEAQGITSNAFYSEQTSYADSNNDPVFFYTSMSGAQLKAPAGTGYTYNWYSFNATTGEFDILEQSGGNTLMTVAENGYMVEVNNAGVINPYYCWNFVPEFSLDSIGIPSATATCSNIRLTAHAKTKPLVYYDHKGDGKPLEIDYGYDWSSVPAGPMDEVTIYSKLISAPFEDTEYSVTVGSKFSVGFTPASTTYSYEAIAVSAAFTYESDDTSDNEANKGSAPMLVNFTDDSKGKVNDWEWQFGASGQPGAGIRYDSVAVWSFRYAGEYPVTLTVRNLESGCEDISAEEIFSINEIVVKVPGAFTPFSSPGENDEFKILYRSVKNYSIVIYNRWGRKVYSSTDPSQGWDGHIGSRKAEPGVYFYSIKAEGYNEGEQIKREGAVHLIVTNN